MSNYQAVVLTISDKGSRGERVDTGGPLVKEMLETISVDVQTINIIPDEKELIKEELISWSKKPEILLIMTTGGTGFAPRDVTPEATIEVSDKLVPGIPEAMRAEGLKVTNRAMLSRMAAGIRDNTLIVNLPGSPKAIKENLEAILPALEHGLEMLAGVQRDCADDRK